MKYTVIVSELAQADIENLHAWIEAAADAATADRYLDRIDARIATLEAFPQRGSPRNTLRPGLRALSFERRILIYFTVDLDIATVTVLRIVHTARDQTPLFDA